MYIRRMVEGLLKEAILQFPVCLVTGARQVGKSTLLRHLLPEYKYVSLDDPRIRKMAKDDPELFLTTYASPVIIDEIQYVPELLSYIKLKVDAKRSEYGRFILTGSQIFQVMTGVTESLAGRICIFNLYPFSFKELNVDLFDDQEVFKAYLKGFYPEFYDNANLDPSLWFSSYISTYLERDVTLAFRVFSELSLAVYPASV